MARTKIEMKKSYYYESLRVYHCQGTAPLPRNLLL